MAALIKRASDLEIITPSKNKQLWITMGKLGYRVREPIELDIPPEKPSLLSEIVKTYIQELNYSTKELSKLLCLNQEEIQKVYISSEQRRLEKETKAAINEINRMLRNN